MNASGRPSRHTLASIEQAAWSQDPSVIHVLVDALSVDDPTIRRAAADALGRIGHPSTLPDLLRVLEDPQADVRRAAIHALEGLTDSRMVAGLLAALKDSSPEVRRAAASVLGRLGDPRAVPALRDALGDADPYTRQAAARSLDAFGVQYTLPPGRSHGRDTPDIEVGQASISNARGRRRTARLFAGLSIVAAISAVTFYALWLWNRPLGPTLQPAPGQDWLVEVPTPVPDAPPPQCGGPPVMLVLLIGTDSLTGELDQGFADVVRIARIDYVYPSVTVLALPRDLRVLIPGIEDRGITHDRLSSAYAYGTAYEFSGGGQQLLAETLAINFGAYVHSYAIGNYQAVADGIDAIGGIEIDVRQPVDDFSAGPQHMDGLTALRYARIRHSADNSSDLSRIDRQTQVLRAIQNTLLRPETITDLVPLIRSLENSVLTDLRPREISSLNCLAQKMTVEDIRMFSLPSHMFQSEIDDFEHEILFPDSLAIQAYIQSFYQGELTQ